MRRGKSPLEDAIGAQRRADQLNEQAQDEYRKSCIRAMDPSQPPIQYSAPPMKPTPPDIVVLMEGDVEVKRG